MENIDIPEIDGFLSQPQEERIRVDGDHSSENIGYDNPQR